MLDVVQVAWVDAPAIVHYEGVCGDGGVVFHFFVRARQYQRQLAEQYGQCLFAYHTTSLGQSKMSIFRDDCRWSNRGSTVASILDAFADRVWQPQSSVVEE